VQAVGLSRKWGVLLAAVTATAAFAAPVRLKPAGAGFEVMMPAKPTPQKRSIKSPEGVSQVNVFLADAHGMVFLASYSTFPAKVVKAGTAALLNGNRDGFAKSLKARVTREAPVRMGKAAGIEFDLKSDNGNEFRSRLYLSGTRLYQVAFGGPTGSLAKQEGARFLGSLKLTQ
jgi:hypothetical protein